MKLMRVIDRDVNCSGSFSKLVSGTAITAGLLGPKVTNVRCVVITPSLSTLLLSFEGFAFFWQRETQRRQGPLK